MHPQVHIFTGKLYKSIAKVVKHKIIKEYSSLHKTECTKPLSNAKSMTQNNHQTIYSISYD